MGCIAACSSIDSMQYSVSQFDAYAQSKKRSSGTSRNGNSHRSSKCVRNASAKCSMCSNSGKGSIPGSVSSSFWHIHIMYPRDALSECRKRVSMDLYDGSVVWGSVKYAFFAFCHVSKNERMCFSCNAINARAASSSHGNWILHFKHLKPGWKRTQSSFLWSRARFHKFSTDSATIRILFPLSFWAEWEILSRVFKIL